MDILTILVESIQSIATILIIIGMVIGFLWKAAFYLNLVLGLIITFLVSYLVGAVGGDAGFAVGVFVVGLIASFVVALIGGLLCLLESFILSSLGFWALWVSGSPTNVLSSGALFGSAIAGALCTGIAAFIGDRVVSLGILTRTRKGVSSRKVKDGRKAYSDKPIRVEILPEWATVVDEKLKKRIYGYAIAYREFKLAAIAKRFGLEKKQVEDILLEFVADGKIKGSVDARTGIFTVKSRNEVSS